MRGEAHEMDAVLEQARSFAFAADAALKDSQRNLSLDGHSKHMETTALKAIRDDIWALEDKVRAAKWATSAAEKADLVSQLDPLMLQVMGKCQRHSDQVATCQDLLRDIVGWCERGTKAYRFAVTPAAAAKGAPRYPAAAGTSGGVGTGAEQQGITAPTSRIPAYKSPIKQPRGQGDAHTQEEQQHQLQVPQLHVTKAGSRIPQPSQQGRRSSLQDTGRPHDFGQAGQACAPSSYSSSGALGAGAAPAAAAAAAAAGGGGAASAVAAMAAALDARAGGPTDSHQATACSGQTQQQQQQQPVGQLAAAWQARANGGGAGSDGGAGGLPAARGSGGGGGARASSRTLLEPSRDDVPLSSAGQLLTQHGSLPDPGAAGGGGGSGSALRASQTGLHDAMSRAALLGRAPRFSRTHAEELAALDAAFGPPELPPLHTFAPQPGGGSGQHHHHHHHHQRGVPFGLVHGGGGGTSSSNGGGDGSFGPLGPDGGSGYGSGASSSNGYGYGGYGGSLASFGGGGAGQLQGPGYNGYNGGGGGGAGGGFGAHSLRTSQEVSLMLRSGLVTQAALLSSNASRMHILHDAVAHKPSRGDDDAPDVPVVPARLKKPQRSLVGKLVRAVAGTLVAAAVTTAGVVAVKEAEEQGLFQGKHGRRKSAASGSSQTDRRQQREVQHAWERGQDGPRQQQQPPAAAAAEAETARLPFIPLGPAPDASAGCG